MIVETTKTYYRWFFGRHYFTWIRKYDRSENIVIDIIKNEQYLTDDDLVQTIDYLEACKNARANHPERL